MSAAAKPSAAPAPDLARNMLLGQHSVSYTSDFTGLPEAEVNQMARQLHAAKRIPRVRP